MIVNFRDEWLRAFFLEDVRSRRIPADLENRLFRKLQMIDDATTDRDLRMPPSNHFEKLHGETLPGFIPFASMTSGGSYSAGMPRPVRQNTCTWTITVIDEASRC